MHFDILEKAEPYYIRLSHSGIEKIAEACRNYIEDQNFTKSFTHYRFPEDQAKHILDLVPFSKKIDFNLERVSLFVTQPGVYYRAHKDGLDHRVSINYTIEILDDRCITSWYHDSVSKKYKIDYLNGKSREIADFIKEDHRPLKTMTAGPNECIIFNTDIFHDWDNRLSQNRRMVLTLRSKEPGSLYFRDVEKIVNSEL